MQVNFVFSSDTDGSETFRRFLKTARAAEDDKIIKVENSF